MILENFFLQKKFLIKIFVKKGLSPDVSKLHHLIINIKILTKNVYLKTLTRNVLRHFAFVIVSISMLYNASQA